MKLTLNRKAFKEKYTIGDLFIDDVFFSNTLEDTNRDLNKNGIFDNGEKKEKGTTCIPFGEYVVIVSMSPKFGRELPRLLDVPEFEGILIHRGNTHEDTGGCILVGENKVVGKVINSTKYETELIKILKAAISREEDISINIK